MLDLERFGEEFWQLGASSFKGWLNPCPLQSDIEMTRDVTTVEIIRDRTTNEIFIAAEIDRKHHFIVDVSYELVQVTASD